MVNDNINNISNIIKKLLLRFVISIAVGIAVLILTNFLPSKKNLQFNFTAKLTPEISQFLNFTAGIDTMSYLNLFHDDKDLASFFINNKNVSKNCNFSIVNNSPIIDVSKENFKINISFISNTDMNTNNCAKSVSTELKNLMDKFFEFEKIRLESFLKDISNLGLQSIIDNKLTDLMNESSPLQLSILDNLKIGYLNDILEERDYFIEFVNVVKTTDLNKEVFNTIVMLTILMTFLILNISELNRLVKKWD